MNVLIGGSVLLIVGSAVALVSGWVGEEESLVWASIGASVAAAAVLIVAYNQGRRQQARAVAHPDLAALSGGTPPVATASVATSTSSAPAEAASAESAPAGSPPAAEAPAPSTSKPVRKKAASRPAGSRAKKGAAKPAARPAEQVVAIPDRKKYHRADCRYAGAKGAEKMTKATARRRAFQACGVCKP